MAIFLIIAGCILFWIPWRESHEATRNGDGVTVFPPGYNGHGVAHTLSAGDIGGRDWYD